MSVLHKMGFGLQTITAHWDLIRGHEPHRVNGANEATCAIVPLAEVLITGMQPIVDKLTAGKRESCRVNGDSVTRITWREVLAEPE